MIAGGVSKRLSLWTFILLTRKAPTWSITIMLGGKPYFLLMVLCWTYAMLKGGQPERIGATILAIGSGLTVAVLPSWASHVGPVEIGVLLVDTACLAAFAVLALRADRFWPIWVSALVGVGALGHLARWFDGPEISTRVYAMSLAIWSYPMLALIAIGTLNHQRRVALQAVARSYQTIAPRARA
jgi:hypothetical protein